MNINQVAQQFAEWDIDTTVPISVKIEVEVIPLTDVPCPVHVKIYAWVKENGDYGIKMVCPESKDTYVYAKASNTCVDIWTNDKIRKALELFQIKMPKRRKSGQTRSQAPNQDCVRDLAEFTLEKLGLTELYNETVTASQSSGLMVCRGVRKLTDTAIRRTAGTIYPDIHHGFGVSEVISASYTGTFTLYLKVSWYVDGEKVITSSKIARWSKGSNVPDYVMDKNRYIATLEKLSLNRIPSTIELHDTVTNVLKVWPDLILKPGVKIHVHDSHSVFFVVLNSDQIAVRSVKILKMESATEISGTTTHRMTLKEVQQVMDELSEFAATLPKAA